jgi:serine/threonine-protein kinase
MSSQSLHTSVNEVVDARVGTLVRGKWTIDSLIGTGGMAAVYAATHRNGNRVALKVLHVQLSVDNNLRTRFKREGYVANTVTHPGVVRVLDDDITDDGAAFLVMELLEGETAAMRSDRLGGRLPIQDAIAILDGLLDVLSAAHGLGVVHRDIKPENIFFTHEREVKVLDFGIARLQDQARKSGAVSASATAGAMGTPAFMPPEQALGRMDEVDALSDVWAAGATMYTLLSGVLVHDYNTPNEVLIAAATRPAPPLASVAHDIPDEICEVVDRALAFNKAQRWSSARAMQYALRQAAAQLSSPALFVSPETAVRISSAKMPIFAPEAGSPAEASGSAPRLVPSSAGFGVPMIAPDAPTLPPLPTGSSMGAVVVSPPAPRRSRFAVVLGVVLAVVGLVTMGGLALTRRRPVVAASTTPPAVTASATAPAGDPPIRPTASVTAAPPPTATEEITEIELPASRTTPRVPRKDKEKEKSWLDRRK